MELGKTQRLKIKSIRSIGATLAGDILLPKKWVPGGATAGEEIEVFLLRDSEDRIIATTRHPLVEVGQFAMLKVRDVTRIGAFLDWGMDKDLFLPYREQLHQVRPNEMVLIYCYLDQSNRICATMRIKDKFLFPRDLKENDHVAGLIYSVNPELGAFVLVNGHFNGRIAREHMLGALRVGQKLDLRVQAIKPDGKIDLSMYSRAHEHLNQDAGTIYRMLRANHGFLKVNDHTDPDSIRALFGMSKAQFKRAAGRLLKQRTIRFEKDGIRLLENQTDQKRH